MRSGDFVYIDYIARIKDGGEIFDSTKEDVAKREGIYDERVKYGPVLIVIDGGFVIPGLNEALKEMNPGDKKKIVVEPEKAFGIRSEGLVKSIPEASFKKQGVDVIPGSFVRVNNLRGRIISVDGGRVKIDFNHPLAGKTLEYEVEIIQEIKENSEKIEALVYYFTGLEKENFDVNIEEKTVEIEVEGMCVGDDMKKVIASHIIKWIEGIETVKFIDVFSKT